MRLNLSHILASALLICSLGPLANAQSFTIGAWQGASGLGISAHVPHENNSFNSYCIAIDFEGVIFEDTNNPGVRFGFAHLIDAVQLKSSQTKSLSLYYGPGVMTGLVANTGTVEGQLVNGLAICVSAIGGVRAVFDRNVEMCLEWVVDLGVHVSPSAKKGMSNSSLYLPGLTRAYLPQLKLHYMF